MIYMYLSYRTDRAYPHGGNEGDYLHGIALVHLKCSSLNVWRHSSRLVNNARDRQKNGVWFDLWPLIEIHTNSTPTLPSKYMYHIHHACTVCILPHTWTHTCGRPKVSFPYLCFDWPTEVSQTNQNKPSYGSFQSLHFIQWYHYTQWNH